MIRALGWLCGIGALLCLSLASCSPETPPAAVMTSSLPENPLPPCPASPNCVRQTRPFALPADTLFDRAQQALEALGPSANEEAAPNPTGAAFSAFEGLSAKQSEI